MFRFQKLDVWQKSVRLSNRVFELTRTFPDDERFGLTSQMRRSAVSIAANIAEESGRISDQDFARFLESAYGSLMELLSMRSLPSSRDSSARRLSTHLSIPAKSSAAC